MTWDLIGQGVCSYELRPLPCILEVRHIYEEDLHSLILYIHAVQCVFTILTSAPLSQTQNGNTSRHTYAQVIDTSSNIYTPVKKKKFQDTSSHIYAKPVTEKSSVWKPVAARSTDRMATDGDSDGGTTPPDHHSSEGSDLTPPLPPRNYNSSEFDIPPLQLCASTSADKLAGSKPTRQCSSCTILPGTLHSAQNGH